MKAKQMLWRGVAGLALGCLAGTAGAQPPATAPAPTIINGVPPAGTAAPGAGAAPAPAAVPGAAVPGPAAQATAPLGSAQAAQAAQVVALVNGERISLAELEQAVKAAGPSPVHLPEAQRRQRQFEILAMLIDNMLMHQFLEKNTPAVGPAEVNKRLAEMEAGLKEQGKSLAEFCHDTAQTVDQLKAGLSDLLRWTAYAGTQVNDMVVDQYYRENKDFFDGVTVRASHIVLRVPPSATEADRARAMEKLRALREAIAAGKADFAEAAKAHSQDPRAASGGDLGFFPRKWVFDESFARAAFALQVGMLSDVVQTDYGYHLIKVTDRKAGKPSDYAKIKEGVREFCLEDRRQQVLGQLRKSAEVKITLP